MRIFSNLAISLDGHIADASAPTKALGTALDRKTMSVLRRQADVILIGAGTLRAHPKTNRVQHAPKSYRQPANAVLTGSGDLDPSWEFWKDPEVTRFVFTTEDGYARASAAAQERAFVIKAGRGKRVDVAQVVSRLLRSGLENILVEGGGETVFQFLEAKLLQEMFVTLTPRILGSHTSSGLPNPSLVGGHSTLWKDLKLLKVRKVKDELYLHYQVKGAHRRV